MTNLEVTRTVNCPNMGESVEVSNTCELCEFYQGTDNENDPSNPDVVCMFNLNFGV